MSWKEYRKVKMSKTAVYIYGNTDQVENNSCKIVLRFTVHTNFLQKWYTGTFNENCKQS